MSLYRDEAIILRTQKLGEADRIITMLTRDHGRIRGVAMVFGGLNQSLVHALNPEAMLISSCTLEKPLTPLLKLKR